MKHLTSHSLIAASLYRSLRAKGLTVRNPIDLLIAAWCSQNDCALIHDDRDFDNMESLEGLQTRTAA